jgi:hypothetical protein
MNTTINNRTNIISTYQGPSPSIPLDAHRQTTNITQIAARILPSIPIRTGAFGVLPVPMPLNWGTTIPPYTYPSPIYPSMNTAFYTDRSLYSLIPTHYIPVTIYPPVIEKRIFITSDGSSLEKEFLHTQTVIDTQETSSMDSSLEKEFLHTQMALDMQETSSKGTALEKENYSTLTAPYLAGYLTTPYSPQILHLLENPL